jgi:ferrous iron transport protein A
MLRIRRAQKSLSQGLNANPETEVNRLEMRYTELTRAPCNETLEVMAIYGDIEWVKRLEYMGVRKGRHIRKIASQPFGGPLIIEVNGSKISLGRNIAGKIEVEVIAEASL